jgi:hypothetical protein
MNVTSAAIIDSEAANDPDSTASIVVPAELAPADTAEGFFRNVGRNRAIKPYVLILTVYFSLVRGAAGADVPAVKVPYATIPATVDGRMNEAEWRDAAIIRGALGDPGAAVYLKYDQENLWVGVRCFEIAAGYPKAHARKPTDLLENDDSVQVVLGITDGASGERGAGNFGGYAGATGQPADAPEYYYQFTANSVGAISRFFIESPLDRPLFQAKSAVRKGEWDVEMKIPFASWGVVKPVGRTFPANFFRFRPPAMMAWYLPGWGNYTPMPLGMMTLLPKEQSAMKTLEAGAATRPVAVKPGPAVAPMRKLATTLEWYPLSSKVIGQITPPTDMSATSVVMSVNGEERLKRELTGDAPVNVVLPITDKEKLPAMAVLRVLSKSGQELASKTVQVVPHGTPSWLHTDAGRDYLGTKVPQPWTKPVIEGQNVKLHDKTIGFGASALPGSVADGLGELFAGEPEVEVNIGGKLITLPKGTPILSMDGLFVRVDSEQRAGSGKLQIRSTVDFDGFTTVKMRLHGVAPASVSKVSIIFPLKREYARFFTRGQLQDTQELAGFGWEGRESPIWLGSQDKGLYFSHDTPLFLSNNPRTQIQIVEEEGRTFLRINLVNASGQIKEVDHIFRFFLQPSPTKKPSLAKTGLNSGKVALWFEDWSDYQGYPDLKKMPEVAKFSADAHKNDLRPILYFNQMLAENAPGFQEFKTDFLVPPGSMWYKRAYDVVGKGVPCYLCCAHGPYGDLLLDGIRKLRDEGNIDGVYMDGTTIAWDCENPSHPGCAGNAIVTWDGHDETRVTGTRNFLKRLRGILEEKGKTPVMIAHCGGGLDLATLSFCDAFWEGEQLWRYRPAYAMPLAKFAVGYCGRPWGWRGEVIPELWRKNTAKLLPWSLLHDTMLAYSCAELERKIYADYSNDATVAYFPYWRPQSAIAMEGGKVLFSFYKKADSTLLIVSNLGWLKQDPVMDLSGLYPGNAINIRNFVTGRPVHVEGRKISLSLEAHDFLALRVSLGAATPSAPEAAETFEKAAFEVTQFNPAQWKINTNEAGVTAKVTDTGARVSSTASAAFATARFIRAIGPAGTLKFKLTRNGRFRINLAGALFAWNGANSGWTADVLSENTGVFYPAATETVEPAPDKPQTLVLSWKNGKLDAICGDKPLVKGLALKGLGSESGLSFSTWAGNWFQFELIKISTKAEELFEQTHPVL